MNEMVLPLHYDIAKMLSVLNLRRLTRVSHVPPPELKVAGSNPAGDIRCKSNGHAYLRLPFLF